MYGEVGVIVMNNQMNDGQINQSRSQISGNYMNPGMRVKSGMSNQTNMKKLPKQAQNNPKYTENWLNLKTIKNDIMYNNQGEMVAGVKIQPKNIFILDRYAMDNTLIGLMNFYNTLDYEFWLVVADRPVDIAMYQAELQLLYNKTMDPRIRKLIAQDMDKGEMFANNNVVDTEYYLLFKEKNMDMLQKKIRNMINGLASCGLVASQASNDDLRTIIDTFLNAGRRFEKGTVLPL